MTEWIVCGRFLGYMDYGVGGRPLRPDQNMNEDGKATVRVHGMMRECLDLRMGPKQVYV